jgi:GntR family transcriptional regulator
MRGPTPIYLQISQIVRSRIASGHYPPGSQMPTDETMMRDFGVSRHTVRLALQSLVDDGMIERYPGKGTFVSQRADVEAVWTVRGVDDVVNDTLDTEREVRFGGKVRAADHPAAIRQFQIGGTTELFLLHIVRYSASGPYGTSNVYLPLHLAAGIPLKEFEQATVGRVVERRHQVRSHRTSLAVSAELADRRISELLRIEQGDAVLTMEQTFYSRENEVLQFTQAQYVPGRRVHRIELRRDHDPEN